MANPAIRLLCPNLRCRTLLAVPLSARGKNVRCRQCGTRIQVPNKAAEKKRTSAVTSDEAETTS